MVLAAHDKGESKVRPRVDIVPMSVKKRGAVFRLKAVLTESWLNQPMTFDWLKTPMSWAWQWDNGLGEGGECPACGYEHVQIYPPGRTPMRCHEAVKLTEKKKSLGHY